MEITKTDIRSLSLQELTEKIAARGEKPFRAKQIYEWIWKKSARSFNEMTNLSLATREMLNDEFAINAVSVETLQKSSDRTLKSRFKLHDNYMVEGVLIPTPNRMTACVSSQVGCSLSCKFCATGRMDRMRNLSADEIYDEVALIRDQALQHYDMPLSNIVFMGMGEPLLNYSNVLKAIERITAHDGLGMSNHRITVSTAGVAKMIKKLGDDEVKFNLAVSLHAANDKKRSEIMPINDSNSLDALAEALRYFYSKTGTRVTYEYIVFNNFNDTLADAQDLYEFSKVVPCKINLIEYNPIDDTDFLNAEDDKIESFREFLIQKGLIVNIRRSRGKDIDAACGQLANK